MLVDEVVGEVIPFAARILVLRGGRITLQRMVHEHLAVAMRAVREEVGPTALGDVAEGERLHAYRVLGQQGRGECDGKEQGEQGPDHWGCVSVRWEDREALNSHPP